MAKLEEVFGVGSINIKSYLERFDVDGAFNDALVSGKQIIVYGSSKQGKTALVSKHLPYKENVVISLTPKTQLIDVYQSLLSKAGVKLTSVTTDKKNTESKVGIGTKFKAMIPLFGSTEAEVTGETSAGSGSEIQYEEILCNLELPESVSDLLKKSKFNKWVILENFHYLNDDIQQQFSFDLRAFQELGVHFVILGVWREKNRMSQFNGDLLDRTVEIPVEPWEEKDFKEVIKLGERELNIEFSQNIVDRIITASFSSIGVLQELLKLVCRNAGVSETCINKLLISNEKYLDNAIKTKSADYASRHQRALEAIAAGHTTGGAKGDLPPLYLPYYLARSILAHGFDGISNGAQRNVVHDWIRSIHHRSSNVRPSDMTNLLTGLANLQSVKGISPPIFAYDSQQRVLQVVDSTFYFFIKNTDTKEIIESLQNPLDK